jgi:mono/diheme cytochrome c family protein
MFRTALLLSVATLLGAQAPDVKRAPAPYTSPASGPEMFKAYCASCHGAQGKGDGPVAKDLKIAVPDLTHLSKAHQGTFPDLKVAQIIKGEGQARAHGSLDMPVWGPVFRAFNDRKDTVIHQRVANLTRYLKDLQAK